MTWMKFVEVVKVVGACHILESNHEVCDRIAL